MMSHYSVHHRTLRSSSSLWFLFMIHWILLVCNEKWTSRRHGPLFVLAQEQEPPLQNVSKNTNRYEEFLKWCHDTLGIKSLVTIQDFQYPQQQHQQYKDDDSKYDHNSNHSYNITTRGLAAKRNIHKGEIVISVPFHALVTLQTTIDHDPILSQVMGPTARQQHGWNLAKTKINHPHHSQQQDALHLHTKDDDDDVIILSYYETALLTVAILYHIQLKTSSPQWFYMDTLLQTNLSSIPFYNASSFHHHQHTPPSHEVQYIIQQIQKDIQDMYQNVMVPLIQQHAHIFGKPIDTKDHDEQYSDLSDGDIHETEQQRQQQHQQQPQEWMYSYEKFEWAFAIVHTRHWHLPLQDLDDMMSDFQPHGSMYRNDVSFDMDHSDNNSNNSGGSDTTDTSTDTIHQMPASLPTEEYISLQQQQLQQQQQREEEENVRKMQHVEEYIQSTSTLSSSSFHNKENMITKHSFMAPLADMMNFGPPCTRGQYNVNTKAFEVVATCDFIQGQEVTFWYSDACDDVILANYGFTHPLIPKCPTIHDWKKRSDMWKEYSESLERLLEDVYQDLHDAIDDLKKCDCSSTTSSTSTYEDSTSTDATTSVESTSTISTMRDGKPPPSKATADEGPRRIRRTKARDMDEEHEEIGL